MPETEFEIRGKGREVTDCPELVPAQEFEAEVDAEPVTCPRCHSWNLVSTGNDMNFDLAYEPIRKEPDGTWVLLYVEDE